MLGFSGEGLCLEDSGFQRNGGLNEGDDTVYTWAVLGDKQIMGVRLVSQSIFHMNRRFTKMLKCL